MRCPLGGTAASLGQKKMLLVGQALWNYLRIIGPTSDENSVSQDFGSLYLKTPPNASARVASGRHYIQDGNLTMWNRGAFVTCKFALLRCTLQV